MKDELQILEKQNRCELIPAFIWRETEENLTQDS
jgi:hypothetical protein